MDIRSAYESKDEVQIIDVREPREWRAGRIEGARHIPMDEIANRLEELEDGARIVIVCRSGQRSGEVAEFLRHKGFEADNLDGGMKAWAKAGLPFSAPDIPFDWRAELERQRRWSSRQGLAAPPLPTLDRNR